MMNDGPFTTAASFWESEEHSCKHSMVTLSVDTLLPERADKSSRAVIDKLDSRLGILFSQAFVHARLVFP